MKNFGKSRGMSNEFLIIALASKNLISVGKQYFALQ